MRARRTAHAAFAAAIVLTSLTAAACAQGSGRPAAPSGSQSVELRLEVGVPTWGEVGLAVLEFQLPRALTADEARHVRLRMNGTSPDKIVAVSARVSSNREVVRVVAAMIRRRGTGAVRRHALMLEGEAVLPDGASVRGGLGQLFDGTLFLHDSARRSSSAPSGGGAVAAGGAGDATSSSNDGRCKFVGASLRGAAAPLLLSGERAVKMPRRRLRNGSPLVSNATPAGLVLDQTVGKICRPPFSSTWLVRLSGWNGPPA